MAWTCASNELEREPGNALGKTAELDGFDMQLPTRKGGLGTVYLPGKKTALLKG